MKTAVLQVRLDADLKKKSDTFFNGMGLETTNAVRLFFKQCLLHRRFPFDLISEKEEEEDPFYSEENLKELRRIYADVKAGKYEMHELIEVGDEG